MMDRREFVKLAGVVMIGAATGGLAVSSGLSPAEIAYLKSTPHRFKLANGQCSPVATFDEKTGVLHAQITVKEAIEIDRVMLCHDDGAVTASSKVAKKPSLWSGDTFDISYKVTKVMGL